MSTPTSSQIEQSIQWVHDTHRAVDARDPKTFVKQYFQPDGVMTFGTNPTAVGHDSIVESFGMMNLLSQMKHTLIPETVAVTADRIFQESRIECVVRGDPEEQVITVKAFAVHWKTPEEEKMRRFDVYGDFSKLAERIGYVMSL